MKDEQFRYADERFADIQMLRYRVEGFDALSLRQKKLVYHLSEAALYGRDILWDQNCRYNLPLRRMLEAVYVAIKRGDKRLGILPEAETRAFGEYIRRVWFANGVHHHYSMDKFKPTFGEDFLRKALRDIEYPVDETLMRLIFDDKFLPKRVNQADGEDLLQTSAMNYYSPDVTQAEAERFYAEQKNAEDPHPVMYGMNSRLERDEEGRLVERTWKSGGMYGKNIDRIIDCLSSAHEVAENDKQRQVLDTLIEFYRTGDLRTFDQYTIQWVEDTLSEVDFTNGFTEVYGDPLGLKASWEGYVNLRDNVATHRTQQLSDNAQWFEDHSPVDSRFKKSVCNGVTAKVVEAAILGGDLYPASAIGINLPNSNWVRQEHGSKSVTIGNLTHAYAEAAKGNGFREEFVIDKATCDLLNTYDESLDDLHTDLHECLGHGSGKLLSGVDPDALKAYGSTIEEARADLFALYYIADPKLIELGLVPNEEAYKSQYYSYLMNGLLTQLVRIELGKQIEEAHMRNRALISRWVMAHCDGAMTLVVKNQKTYLQISDYPALRLAIGKLLAEVQRIKSEGDFEAARRLVEDYGVEIDADLHNEMLSRYRALNLAPYKGFINPCYNAVRNDAGEIVDVKITYGEAFDEQMLRYGRDYSL